jgi:hypothetical protein
MPMFEKDSAGNLRPKPWRDPRPPAPFDRTLFSAPFLAALGIVAVGLAFRLTGITPQIVADFIMAGGTCIAMTYSILQLRRVWHEVRWMSSAPTAKPMDDEWLP